MALYAPSWLAFASNSCGSLTNACDKIDSNDCADAKNGNNAHSKPPYKRNRTEKDTDVNKMAFHHIRYMAIDYNWNKCLANKFMRLLYLFIQPSCTYPISHEYFPIKFPSNSFKAKTYSIDLQKYLYLMPLFDSISAINILISPYPTLNNHSYLHKIRFTA